ncbi:histidine kinase [Candidatus Desantisbacteria bacterium]|nr:histidine kinase [Candidatus Desantisbacteria bacterium]
MSLNFFWEIIGKISIILISIYLLTQHKWFYYLFASLNSNYLKIYYNTIFIILGLAGLLLSTNLNGFIINNIHLSIVLSGLLGGLDSALITTFALDIIIFIFNFNHPPLGIIISTSILGIFCGFYNKIYDVKRTEIKKILPIIVVTFLLQILTNLIRLKVTSFSITQIWTLLYKEILAIIINIASGTYITLKIIKNTFNSYQNMEALHAHDTLKIADKTLPYLRTGLNPETALMTVKLIMDITDVEAVAITDKEKVLAFEGIGSDHHKSGAYILTSSTRNVLKKGHAYIISNKKDIGCPVEDCPLVSAVVAPLKCKNEVVGTLKLYQSRQKEINPSKVSLAMGLANLLSIQMELSEVGKLEKLTVQAELRALQAQINPHFLFNTLNTIASFSRTQPDEARQLLIKFADFFRKK